MAGSEQILAARDSTLGEEGPVRHGDVAILPFEVVVVQDVDDQVLNHDDALGVQTLGDTLALVLVEVPRR